MSIEKVGGKRNFGFGRSLNYAADCALRDRYGDGRFGNRHTLLARINIFIKHMKQERISDYRDVTSRVVWKYAEVLRRRVDRGDLSLNTAVNYVSAVNCLFTALRSDRSVWVSPGDALGPRCFVRVAVPESLDPMVVEIVSQYLDSIGELRLAAVLRLCRVLGLRFREASLLNFRDASNEATAKGEVTVVFGTKGGRPRVVAANANAIAVLQSISSMFPTAKNLIPRTWPYIKWQRFCYRAWRKSASVLGTTSKFSDLRAGFACSLYESEAGAVAPVVAGGRVAAVGDDRRAREIVASALGHGRAQIAGAYVGTSVAAKE